MKGPIRNVPFGAPGLSGSTCSNLIMLEMEYLEVQSSGARALNFGPVDRHREESWSERLSTLQSAGTRQAVAAEHQGARAVRHRGPPKAQRLG